MVFNIDVRNEMKDLGYFGYQVASELGMAEASFSRKLSRAELTPEDKQKIMEAIHRMAERRNLNA